MGHGPKTFLGLILFLKLKALGPLLTIDEMVKSFELLIASD